MQSIPLLIAPDNAVRHLEMMFVQQEIAERIIKLLIGAIQELSDREILGAMKTILAR